MKVLAVITLAFAIANGAPIDGNSIDEDVEYIDLSPYGASIFKEPSNLTGDLVSSYDPNTDEMNPEELGEYLEGDMRMPQSYGRNGVIATASHWPNGVVPYEIDGHFGTNTIVNSLLLSIFATFNGI